MFPWPGSLTGAGNQMKDTRFSMESLLYDDFLHIFVQRSLLGLDDAENVVSLLDAKC